MSAALFQLSVQVPGARRIVVDLVPLPFLVGRHPQASLVLTAAGVWDRHLRFDLDAGEGLVMTSEAGALVSRLGEVVERYRVRNGDELQAGAARLQVVVAAPERRSLVFWEVILWSLLAVVLATQIAAAAWLLRG